MRNDSLAKRMKIIGKCIYGLGGVCGFFLLGFWPLAILLWFCTYALGSLFTVASFIITRLDDIALSLNPTSETPEAVKE